MQAWRKGIEEVVNFRKKCPANNKCFFSSIDHPLDSLAPGSCEENTTNDTQDKEWTGIA